MTGTPISILDQMDENNNYVLGQVIINFSFSVIYNL